MHPERANRIAFALRDALAAARRRRPRAEDLGGLARHVVVRTTRDEREAVAMLVVTRATTRRSRRRCARCLAGRDSAGRARR